MGARKRRRRNMNTRTRTGRRVNLPSFLAKRESSRSTLALVAMIAGLFVAACDDVGKADDVVLQGELTCDVPYQGFSKAAVGADGNIRVVAPTHVDFANLLTQQTLDQGGWSSYMRLPNPVGVG